jgi:hypothetical protein
MFLILDESGTVPNAPLGLWGGGQNVKRCQSCVVFFLVKKLFPSRMRYFVSHYQKSNIYPNNVDEDKIRILTSTFWCKVWSFPFTYLGLPMGTTKSRVKDFIPLVQRIERLLVSTSNFLKQAGRLEMVNPVLSALPTFSWA